MGLSGGPRTGRTSALHSRRGTATGRIASSSTCASNATRSGRNAPAIEARQVPGTSGRVVFGAARRSWLRRHQYPIHATSQTCNACRSRVSRASFFRRRTQPRQIHLRMQKERRGSPPAHACRRQHSRQCRPEPPFRKLSHGCGALPA